MSHQVLSKNTLTKKIALYLCPVPINSQNPLWQHKSTDPSTRGFYESMHHHYLAHHENAELIFSNEDQYVTESRFYNLIVEIDGIAYTPPIKSGLLPGIARAKLIKKGQLHERVILIDELKKATKIYLINDVRGKLAAYLDHKLTLIETYP